MDNELPTREPLPTRAANRDSEPTITDQGPSKERLEKALQGIGEIAVDEEVATSTDTLGE